MNRRAFFEKGSSYKRIWFFDPIFRVNVEVVIGISTGKQINEWLKIQKGIDHESRSDQFEGHTLTLDSGMNIFIFLKSDAKRNAKFYANLAHEAFHAAHMILSLRGQENRDDAGEESHAYVLGWIVREILEALDLLKIKVQKKPTK